MNAARRKELEGLKEQFEELRGTLEDLKTNVEAIRDEEQDYYDNMPEGIRDGDKGYAAESAISNLEDVIGRFDDFDVDDIISSLEEAQS